MKQKPTIFLREAISSLMHGLGSVECSDVKFSSDGVSYTVPEVHLTSEVLQKAAKRAAEVYAEAKSYSERNINTGLLGQGAVTYYLWNDVNKGIEQMEVGRPDEYDIMYNGFKIDIKTFNWPKPSEPDTWMLVPCSQFNSRKYAYYIACQRNSEETVRILGFISRSRLENDGVLITPDMPPFYKHPSIGLYHLSSLTLIKELHAVTLAARKEHGFEGGLT